MQKKLKKYREDPVKFLKEFSDVKLAKYHEIMLDRLLKTPLNVYEVTPQHSWCDEGGYEYLCFWHVIAPTRSRAWYLYCKFASSYGGENVVEFILNKRHTRILAHDVNWPEGVDEDFKWAKSIGFRINIHKV